jgi:hypothetical protein
MHTFAGRCALRCALRWTVCCMQVGQPSFSYRVGRHLPNVGGLVELGARGVALAVRSSRAEEQRSQEPLRPAPGRVPLARAQAARVAPRPLGRAVRHRRRRCIRGAAVLASAQPGIVVERLSILARLQGADQRRFCEAKFRTHTTGAAGSFHRGQAISSAVPSASAKTTRSPHRNGPPRGFARCCGARAGRG